MNVTTSIPDELAHLAREKNLKWNECLILGIKTALNQPFVLREGETIDQESYKAKFIAAERRGLHLQALLNKIPIEILNKAANTPDENTILSPS